MELVGYGDNLYTSRVMNWSRCEAKPGMENEFAPGAVRVRARGWGGNPAAGIL
jgi:hypothetical protein